MCVCTCLSMCVRWVVISVLDGLVVAMAYTKPKVNT